MVAWAMPNGMTANICGSNEKEHELNKNAVKPNHTASTLSLDKCDRRRQEVAVTAKKALTTTNTDQCMVRVGFHFCDEKQD
jgi:hypothetical protein